MTNEPKKTEAYIYPKDFFEKNKSSIVEDLCFVMMPFDQSLIEVYRTIERALAELGHRAVRADQIFDTRPIMISVMEKINEADLVIADVTGRNPNVFYELGLAHVLKDRVVLITQAIEDVPFDLRHFRHIVYQPTPEGMAKLRQSLLDTINAVGLAREPITQSAQGEQAGSAHPEYTVLEPLSTTIIYEGSYEELKGKMFAVLARWVEYDQVEERFNALAFQGGTFSGEAGELKLTLQPGSLPINEAIAGFGLEYRATNFKLDNPFDIGEFIRRSRGGTRKLESLEKDRVTMALAEGSKLVVENTGEGASLTVFAGWTGFKSGVPPVPLTAVLNFLLEEPPSGELQEAIRLASGLAKPKQ